jgi:hypothetical protein
VAVSSWIHHALAVVYAVRHIAVIAGGMWWPKQSGNPETSIKNTTRWLPSCPFRYAGSPGWGTVIIR